MCAFCHHLLAVVTPHPCRAGEPIAIEFLLRESGMGPLDLHANSASIRSWPDQLEKPAVNVLIVDDHPMMLEYLSGVVARAFSGASVHTAPDLEAGLAAADERSFNLVLLDLGLPGHGGIESLLQFRRQHPDCRVVVVTAVDDEVSVRGALAAGASGYIPKTSRPSLVVNALRLVAEGGTYVPQEALAGALVQTPESGLTDRQREIMRHLLRGRTHSQISKDLGISYATVKHHARAVYAAFRVASRADLIVAANKRGVASG